MQPTFQVLRLPRPGHQSKARPSSRWIGAPQAVYAVEFAAMPRYIASMSQR